jgi:hypothetical protein
MNERCVFSLTTTPARIAHVCRTLNASDLSAVSQIWLHLPPTHTSSGCAYPSDKEALALLSPPLLHASIAAKLRINHTLKDWGPLTKYLGCLSTPECAAVPSDAIIIVGDDDFCFPTPTLSVLTRALVLAEQMVLEADAVVSSSGQMATFWGAQRAFSAADTAVPGHAIAAEGLLPGARLVPVDVCEGFSGVAMRMSTLRTPGFAAMTTRIVQHDAACWGSDDLVVSAVLAFLHIPRFVLLPRLPITGFSLPEPLSACAGGNAKKYAEAAPVIARILSRL